MDKKLVSIPEAARVLSVSKDTVRRLLDRGELKKIKVLRRVLIPAAELERLCKLSS